VQFTAVASAPAIYTNPRAGGSCRVDPSSLVTEINEGNNTEQYADQHTNGDEHAHADGHADGYGDANGYGHADAEQYANQYANGHGHADAEQYANQYTN